MGHFVGGGYEFEKENKSTQLQFWLLGQEPAIYYVPKSVQGQELKRPDQYTVHCVKLQPEASTLKKACHFLKVIKSK